MAERTVRVASRKHPQRQVPGLKELAASSNVTVGIVPPASNVTRNHKVYPEDEVPLDRRPITHKGVTVRALKATIKPKPSKKRGK